MADSQVAESVQEVTHEQAAEPVAEQSFNLDAAVDKIGASLFPSQGQDRDKPVTDEPAIAEVAAPKEPVVDVAPVPKTWPKEMHPHWEKTPKEVQTYWATREEQMMKGLEQYRGAAQFAKTMSEVIQPFERDIQAQGIDAPGAVRALLQAHARLTNGPIQDRVTAYRQLGHSLGIFDQNIAAEGQQSQVDPQIQSLGQQVQQMQQFLHAQQETVLQETRGKITQDIEKFAADPAHAHFDEVADDIVLLIKAGLPLPEAYDKAVWANPVTRQKELSRQQTAAVEKAKENARLAALPKKGAASVNVRSRESQRAPTEPLGSMQETMKQTFREIRSRAS